MGQDNKLSDFGVEITEEVLKAKKKAAKGRGLSFKPYVDDVRTRLAKVEEKRAKNKQPGSEKLYKKLRSQNKLTARERIEALFDEGTFSEYSIFAESQIKEMGMDSEGM